MHRESCPSWMVAGIIIWLVIFTGLRSSDRPHPKIGKNQTKAKVPSQRKGNVSPFVTFECISMAERDPQIGLFLADWKEATASPHWFF
ncbi:anoctamin-like protein [Gossypium australe]|uniref:Anoctamin-like protein n=1 Tax=Gossypium australe TaxID=47621 RepID=A0A5B6WC27_9ROSI|nr:anoctamin-like protein [Gossypium australe]